VRADQRRILAVTDERQRWRAYAADSFRQGFALGRASAAADTGWTTADLMNAYLAGRRAASRHKSAFDAGAAAVLDRVAGQLGGRIYPDRPTASEVRRWTRHHPDCKITARGGRRPCKRFGCLPGPRQDYGKPAPWSESGPELRRRVAESWAKWEADQARSWREEAGRRG
jgi:hypothetical protein